MLAIILIFNGGESMREGLMFIANMKKTEPLKVRRWHNLRNILGGMWVPEPHLLGGRPICCTVYQFEWIGRKNGWPMGSVNEDDIRCDLCSCDLELDYVIKYLSYTTVWYYLICHLWQHMYITCKPNSWWKRLPFCVLYLFLNLFFIKCLIQNYYFFIVFSFWPSLKLSTCIWN